MMVELAGKIAAAAAQGDVQALATLAIELAQENSRLAGHAAALEQAQREHEVAERAKKDADAERKRLARASRPRKSTDVHGQTGTGADVQDAAPSSLPQGSSSPTPLITPNPNPPTPKLSHGAKQPAPWLGRFCAAWRAQYDGDMPTGPAVGPLRKLIRQHGEEEVYRRWVIYLAATGGSYASAAKFAATWGDWSAAPAAKVPGTNGNGAHVAQAAVLWERYKTLNLLTKWDRPEYERIAAQEVAAGHYPSVDAFLNELRVTKPWELGDSRTDGYGINALAARLSAPQRVAV